MLGKDGSNLEADPLAVSEVLPSETLEAIVDTAPEIFCLLAEDPLLSVIQNIKS
jgi:hypothetical protein